MCWVFPGGGIRDSWNHFLEETSDIGGMCIIALKDFSFIGLKIKVSP